MTTWWRRAAGGLAGGLLAAAVLAGSGMTAWAAEGPVRGEPPGPPPAMDGQRFAAVREYQERIHQLRERIRTERAELRGRLETIRSLIQELRQAIRERDPAAAREAAQELANLLETRLELLGRANQTAEQAIAHLRAAQQGE